MLTTFKDHIDSKLPFLKDAKLLVTVSGGVDSVVLAHILHQLKYDIVIAHCNFCLRDEASDADELFVKNLALQLKVPFFTKRFSTTKYASKHKLSIQEAARNLRYQWFDVILKEQQRDYIITAHNLNDNLETFLINLTRGTGLKGLTGIPMLNKKIVRPLMMVSRKEILIFAKQQDICWREDTSNTNTKYTRNKIRHQVIPVLEEINPSLLKSFKQTLENLQSSQHIIEDRIFEVQQTLEMSIEKTEPQKFRIKKLTDLRNSKAYIHELFSPYNFTNFDDIVTLLSAQSGKQLFSKTHRLVKDRDFLLLSLKDNNQDLNNKKREISQLLTINETDETFNIEHETFKINSLKTKTSNPELKNQNGLFDKDLLKFPLTVRKWKKGDYFYPIGMHGKKKLSKYFKDEKMSLLEKEKIWLLLTGDNIVWVIGKRQDNRYKITVNTKNILKINQKVG